MAYFRYTSCIVTNLLVYLGPLIEEPSSVTRSQSRCLPFWIQYTPWSFVCLLMSMCYNGILMENMSSLKPGKYDSLMDIYCSVKMNVSRKQVLQKQSDLGKYYWARGTIKYPPVSSYNYTDCFSILSPLGVSYTKVIPYSITSYVLFEIAQQILLDIGYISLSSGDVNKVVSIFYNLMHPQSRYFPKRYLTDYVSHFDAERTNYEITSEIDKELAQCGRSVFFESEEAVISYWKRLKRRYPNTEWYLGKERFLRRQYYLKFERVPASSKIPNMFKTAFEWGLYSLLQSYANHNNFTKSSKWYDKNVNDE